MLPGFPMPLMAKKKPLIPEDVQSLPQMTAVNAPSGHVATASSFYTGGGYVYRDWRAFDQLIPATNFDSFWITDLNIVTGWLQRQVPTPIAVMKYRIRAFRLDYSPHLRMPKNFQLLGSNDGVNFDTLDTRVNQIGWNTGLEIREFSVSAPSYYTHYRLNITENNGATDFVGVEELELIQGF